MVRLHISWWSFQKNLNYKCLRKSCLVWLHKYENVSELVWHSSKGVGHTNEGRPCWVRVILGGSTISTFLQATQPSSVDNWLGLNSTFSTNRLSCLWHVPPWIGAASTGDGFGHHWGRNDKFCTAVGPIIKTASILAYLYANLTGSNPRSFKCQRR